MSDSVSATRIPGLVPGTWKIDPAHSEVSFTVRHLMVSKVRGHFTSFEGEIEIAPDPLQSSVDVTIDMSSIDTRDQGRDNHLRSSDFFDVSTNPSMTFRSTAIRPDGDDFVVEGDLTIHGVTRPVELELAVNGAGSDPWGGTRAGFSATTEISRKEFGIDLAMPLEGGGVVVGDKINIIIEVEAILQGGAEEPS